MIPQGECACRPSARRGSVLIAVLLFIPVFFALLALSIDWGKTVSAESELQTAADAGARAGVRMLTLDPDLALAAAHGSVAENDVDGRTVPVARRTIQLGKWNEATRTFVTSPADEANAVRVELHLPAGETDGVDTFFHGSSTGAHAEAIAALLGQVKANKWVPATSNIWLAGSPAGTIANQYNPHKNPDYAGLDDTSELAGVLKASAVRVDMLDLTDMDSLAFDAIVGGAQHHGGAVNDTADGDVKKMASNRYANGLYDSDLNPLLGQSKGTYDVLDMNIPQSDGKVAKNGGENGKSNLKAPYSSLIGVFLGPDGPIVGQEPTSLDFMSNASSREFTSLSPEIAQPFFIGDGITSAGEQQTFEIPEGATRLFLGVMDSYEWGNNVGGMTVAVREPGTIRMVK
ncbi:MAG: pilus assembly protein TadG-related protein [Planctomycetota bacterium]